MFAALMQASNVQKNDHKDRRKILRFFLTPQIGFRYGGLQDQTVVGTKMLNIDTLSDSYRESGHRLKTHSRMRRMRGVLREGLINVDP